MADDTTMASRQSVYLGEETLADLQARLSRIEGQIGGIKRMLAARRDCDDILTQVSSVKAAVSQVAVLLLQDHLQSCVAESIRNGDPESAVERFGTSLARALRSA